MIKSLNTKRILSIDAFRGITILVMIFVNELAGVQGIPAWMKHMPADADAMTFVDVVFPAFLFIVGMSIPFAINNRLSKGDNVFQLQQHILARTIGLLILGIFMVNAEGGYNENAMGMTIRLWSFLFYICVILVWNVYTFQNRKITYILRTIGIIGILALALMYRGGDDGMQYLTPQWWGILGLIGWAYLISSILYQVLQGNKWAVFGAAFFCIAYYCLGKTEVVKEYPALKMLFSQGGHAAHTSIVLFGIILSLIYFDEGKPRPIGTRYSEAFIFTIILLAAGFFLRPYYQISKIFATPTWCLYSAVICCLVFGFLYWLIDLKKVSAWTAFFKPAASNPLLTYIIPFIIFIPLPEFFRHGLVGILWSAGFAVMIMGLVVILNKLKIRLHL
jgi:predicted acyltransferase